MQTEIEKAVTTRDTQNLKIAHTKTFMSPQNVRFTNSYNLESKNIRRQAYLAD